MNKYIKLIISIVMEFTLENICHSQCLDEPCLVKL